MTCISTILELCRKNNIKMYVLHNSKTAVILKNVILIVTLKQVTIKIRNLKNNYIIHTSTAVYTNIKNHNLILQITITLMRNNTQPYIVFVCVNFNFK